MKKDLAIDLLEMAVSQRDEPAVLATALIALDRLIASKPDHASAHYASGRILMLLGRTQLALGAFRMAVTQDPSLAMAHYYEGVCSWLLGRDADGLAQISIACQLEPQLFDAHFDAGQILSSMRRHQEALVRFEQARKLRPSDFVVLKKILQTLLALGRYEQARHVRAELRNLWATSGDTALRGLSSYVFDQFDVGPLEVMAVETFEPSGDPSVLYSFAVSTSGELLFTVNLESSAYLRQQGTHYILALTDGDAHVNSDHQFADEPRYGALKPLVVGLIRRYMGAPNIDKPS